MAVERRIKRAIYSQGFFDGACFLYSLANAVRCVAGQSVPEKAWRRAVRESPFRVEDFLSGDGTARLDRSTAGLLLAGQEFIGKLDEDLYFSTYEADVSPLAVAQAAKESQVIVTAIDNGAHWVPIVDSMGDQACIACSLAVHDWTVQYDERTSPNKRVFNVSRNFDGLEIWTGPSFIVTRSVKSP